MECWSSPMSFSQRPRSDPCLGRFFRLCRLGCSVVVLDETREPACKSQAMLRHPAPLVTRIGQELLTSSLKRVWLKIKQEGLRRFWVMFPLTRVPFWYRFLSHSQLASLPGKVGKLEQRAKFLQEDRHKCHFSETLGERETV